MAKAKQCHNDPMYFHELYDNKVYCITISCVLLLLPGPTLQILLFFQWYVIFLSDMPS